MTSLPAPGDLVAILLHLGIGGIFLFSLAEKFAPVVPSYVVLTLFGMAAPDPATLALSVLATASGSLIGSLAWYGIGRGFGEDRVRRAVARIGGYVFFGPKVYDRLAASYRANHFRVTLIGQIVPVARVYLALPAGVLRLRPFGFATALLAGILLWNTPFIILGHFLRGGASDPVDIGFWVSAGLICVEVAVLAAFGLRKRLARRSSKACATAATA